jgi:MFS family permease
MNPRIIIFFLLTGSYLGFYLAFPIFPTLFLNENFAFFSKTSSLGMGNILLGFTYAFYYIGSFIGTPIIGSLSDKYGRKKILASTFFICGLMYLLSGLSLKFSSLPLLILLRFFTGFFDGCYSLAYSTLISLEKKEAIKTNHLEFWSTIFINAGWIAGSYIGWNLIGATNLSLWNLSFSFFGSSLVYTICFLLIILFYKEDSTFKFNDQNKKINFLRILNIFKKSQLTPIFISNSTFYAATFIFTSYIPVFLMNKHKLDASSIATIESFLSISYCFAPFTYWIYSKHFCRKKIMLISSLGTFLSLILFMIFQFKSHFWIFIFSISYFSALGFSFSSFLVADHSPENEHGEALGISQSLFTFIEASMSLFIGLLAALWIYLPLLLSLLFAFVSSVWIMAKLLDHPIYRRLTSYLQK